MPRRLRAAARAAPGLGLVGARGSSSRRPSTWFALRPGDRPLVCRRRNRRRSARPWRSCSTTSGWPTHRHRRSARAPRPAAAGAVAAAAGPLGRRARRPASSGELLFKAAGDWRVADGRAGRRAGGAGGGHRARGPPGRRHRAARRGRGDRRRPGGRRPGARPSRGGPGRGRRRAGRASTSGGRARSSSLGGRVDAETLTRARAMGMRGIVVGSLTAQGPARLRRIGGAPAREPPPTAAVRGRWSSTARSGAGRVARARGPRRHSPAARSRSSPIRRSCCSTRPGSGCPRAGPTSCACDRAPWGGREGRWAGPAGIRQFRGGVRLEAGVRPARRRAAEMAVPLGDLERFA